MCRRLQTEPRTRPDPQRVDVFGGDTDQARELLESAFFAGAREIEENNGVLFGCASLEPTAGLALTAGGAVDSRRGQINGPPVALDEAPDLGIGESEGAVHVDLRPHPSIDARLQGPPH